MANNKSLDLKDIINVANALTKEKEDKGAATIVSALSSLGTTTKKEEKQEGITALLQQAAKGDAKDNGFLSQFLENMGLTKSSDKKEEEELIALLEERGYSVEKESLIDKDTMTTLLTALANFTPCS